MTDRVHPSTVAARIGLSARESLTTQPNNLPLPGTSFVGRGEQVQEVRRLLARTRLLTLTGAGGCGKTRLALRAAADVSDAYTDGVWLVELAALTDPALVAQAVAQAVGMREVPGRDLTDTLVDHLRERTSLLILDNCEHVVDAAAHVAYMLLRACPGVRILATSREPLRSAGETTWRVPSLSVPPAVGATAADLETVLQFESVQLFIDRAHAALPSFELTSANATALQEVCRRLDGIPLAIELAAARVRAFAVEQIAARLDDRFALLTTGPRTAMPRQQTLRAAVDWSYALLSEPERGLLRRLSVFAGGWTLEAVDAVAAGDGLQPYAVLDLLAQLVDKSLVLAEQQRGAARYRLLETIRQYARERLDEAGEAECTCDRHLAYFLDLAETAEPKLRGPEARTVMDRLEEEHDNLRLAIDWALQTGGDAALRLSGALAWFWWGRDYHSEGCRWLARALTGTQVQSAARMKALNGAGWLAHHQRDLDKARMLLAESLAIARELDDGWTVAWTLHCLGRVAYFDNDPQTARSLGEQSLAIAQEVGDPTLIAWAHHLLGLAAYIAADDATARAHYERSLTIRRELGFEEGIGILLSLLGLVAVRQGDLGQAHARYRETLITVHGLLGPWALCMPLAGLSRIAVAWGQPLRAVRLGAAATALSESYQTPLIPLFEPLLAEGLDKARQALSDGAYQQAWSEGRAMSVDAAVAEALNVEVAPAPARDTHGPGRDEHGPLGSLTATELQVLRLLASGRTTKEIAGELIVAVSTADRHITHIYNKLSVHNRAEATALASKHGLI